MIVVARKLQIHVYYSALLLVRVFIEVCEAAG